MQTLSDFLTQVGHAAVDMAQACARQSQARLQEHLEDDGAPKTIPVCVGDREVSVPTLTLAPPSVLLPETVELELESDVILRRMKARPNSKSASPSAIPVLPSKQAMCG